MPPDDEKEQCEAVRDLLLTLDTLSGAHDIASRRAANEIYQRIVRDYQGPAHAALHCAILDHLAHANTRVLAAFLCLLPVQCRDSLELTMRMLARLMRVAEWNGVGTVSAVPKLKDPRWSTYEMASARV